MDFFDTLRDMNAWWLPISVFLFFSIIGLVFGAINGWKSSLYWLGVNFIGAGVAIGLTVGLWSRIVKPISNILKDSSINISNFQIIKGVSILVAIFGVTLVFNMIALFVYIFLRRKLKNSMKNNKRTRKSNLNSRIIGSGIGIFSVLPTSLLFTSVGTAFSTNHNVNKMFSGLTKLSTFGFVNNISEDFEGIYAIFKSVDVFEDVANIFTGENLKEINIKKIKESSSSINTMLENKSSYPLLNEILENQKGITKGSKLDSKKLNDIKTTHPDIKGSMNFLSQKAKHNAINLINKYFKDKTENDDVAKSLVSFLTGN